MLNCFDFILVEALQLIKKCPEITFGSIMELHCITGFWKIIIDIVGYKITKQEKEKHLNNTVVWM